MTMLVNLVWVWVWLMRDKAKTTACQVTCVCSVTRQATTRLHPRPMNMVRLTVTSLALIDAVQPTGHRRHIPTLSTPHHCSASGFSSRRLVYISEMHQLVTLEQSYTSRKTCSSSGHQEDCFSRLLIHTCPSTSHLQPSRTPSRLPCR